jgi:hypothetical protein
MTETNERPRRIEGAVATEDQGLTTREEYSNELAPTGQAAESAAQVQAALVIAQRFPRDEDAARQALIRTCRRVAFAERAQYNFPRGGGRISGPTVNLLREAARCWGHVRVGMDVVADDNENRTVRGWAWDMQTNTFQARTATFRKLQQRKVDVGGGQKATQWIEPDERDLRELTNRHGALCERNAMKAVLPADLIDTAEETAVKAVRGQVATNPDAVRDQLIQGFDGLNVPISEVREFLGGTELAAASPSQLAELRAVYAQIDEGDTTWTDVLGKRQPTVNGTPEPASAERAEMERRIAPTNAPEVPISPPVPPASYIPQESVSNASVGRLAPTGLAYLRQRASEIGVSWEQVEDRFGGPLETHEDPQRDPRTLFDHALEVISELRRSQEG